MDFDPGQAKNFQTPASSGPEQKIKSISTPDHDSLVMSITSAK